MPHTTDHAPVVLSIAGSDPTGGAGLQADLKTLTSLGVYGAAVPTCITVQNSGGVSRVEPLSGALVAAQVAAVLDDLAVDIVKIGMLGTSDIAKALGPLLADFRGWIVVDPVLSASTGQDLTQSPAPLLLVGQLAGQRVILTPNLPELARLTGQALVSHAEAVTAGRKLLADHPSLAALVIKGGHLDSDDQVCDTLLQPQGEPLLDQRPRHPGPDFHGTGCTYASALAAFLAQGQDPARAFKDAGAYMDSLIKCSLSVMGGTRALLQHQMIHVPIER